MSRYGWHGDASLAEWLAAEPHRFEFLQAVRLLEQIALHGTDTTASHQALAEGSEPDREAVRLRADIGFDFPPSTVRSLRIGDTARPELTANLYALAGGAAPLPDWVAELLLAQERMEGRAFRDFLDIFHHRLLSLYYRIYMRHHPWLDPVAPSASGSVSPGPGMARYLLAFAGLGLAELQHRLGIADVELLPYVGLLWQQPRSIQGLERLLEHALQVNVESRTLLGSWSRIEPEDRTRLAGRRSPGSKRRLASSGQNCVLGHSAVLGTRTWHPQGRFDLLLGPLSLGDFRSLLPQGARYRTLRQLVRFYAGDLFEVKVHLRLESNAAPGSRLGRSGTYLGWTSWLKPQQRGNGPWRTVLLPGL